MNVVQLVTITAGLREFDDRTWKGGLDLSSITDPNLWISAGFDWV